MEFILTDRSLHGQHLFSKHAGIEAQETLSQKQNLEKVLRRAWESGVKQILCISNPLLTEVLTAHAREWPFEYSVMVPNFAQFVRDSSHYGTTGAPCVA